ncbi:MAG: PDZ domain-containing protein [Planctomycetota bacterium]
MTWTVIRRHLPAVLALACSACSFSSQSLAETPPPLADLEEPLDLREEPKDELQRAALDPGSFTGVSASDARQSLDALEQEPEGVLVARIVENSPADAAGLEVGDLLLEARVEQRVLALHWPSEWRRLELDTAPGSTLELTLDRAGVEVQAKLVTAQRVRPVERAAAERFREDEKVGVVVRTATEVEARAASLGPGGGAVIVGLARGSPWRKDGLAYGDLVTAVHGAPCSHPEVLLEAIRSTDEDSTIALDVLRAGQRLRFEAHVSRRASQVHAVSIPFLFRYSNDRGQREMSILLGLYKRESTQAAWKTRILWFITFSGGDSDRLEEERS